MNYQLTLPKETYKSKAHNALYDKKYCDEIIDAGMRGLNFKEFASKIDVWAETLRNWAAQHPEFKVAYMRAKQEQENYWMRQAREYGMFNPKDFNTGLFCFIMKARYGWRENDLVDEDGDNELEFVDE
jgi:hypothetical protein